MHTDAQRTDQHGRDVVHTLLGDVVGGKVQHVEALLLLSHTCTDVTDSCILREERQFSHNWTELKGTYSHSLLRTLELAPL